MQMVYKFLILLNILKDRKDQIAAFREFLVLNAVKMSKKFFDISNTP